MSNPIVNNVLGVAYNSGRFQKYAQETLKAKQGKCEDAANEVIWHAASKMTAQGAVAGIPGGLVAVGTTGVDISSVLYHTVEMCGVLAELYDFDTTKEEVRTLVLAAVTGDGTLINSALKIVNLAQNPKVKEQIIKELIKKQIVPILKQLGIKVGGRSGIKLMQLVPVVGAAVGAGTNFYTINTIGHEFLNYLKTSK